MIRISLLLLAATSLLPLHTIAQVDPASVTIVRDKWGVPHIYGPTDASVAYGLAWAHSEDDFHSIIENVILGKARMGEVKGVEGAKFDYFVHYTRARQLADTQYETDLTPKFRQVLEAYAAGLTAYASAHPDELPLKDLLPITGKDIMTTITVSLCAMTGGAKALEETMGGRTFGNMMSYGSNGFAFGPGKMADSSTVVVNDPHWLSDGSITFYEAHLQSDEGWNILGGFYPGMPAPANGVTPNLAWNLPFNFPDGVDVYRLTMHPDDPLKYRYNGEWRMLEQQMAPLKAKVGPVKLGVKREVLWSVYGPAIRTKHGVYATRMTANQNLRGAEQLYYMSRAASYPEFRKAMDLQGMPLFHIIYGDRDGHVFYIYHGNIPVRNPAYNWQQTLPGDTSATLWTELLPHSHLPQVLDPACGYVYNTNNSPWHCTAEAECPKAQDFPPNDCYQLNFENDRSVRLREWMEGRGKLALKDVLALKFDLDYPKEGGVFRPTLRKLQTMLDPARYPKLKDAIAQMQKVELDGRLDNRSTPIFMFTFWKLYHELEPTGQTLLTGKFTFSEEELAKAMTWARQQLLRYHGRLDPTLAEVQFTVRGDSYVAAPGLPQVLNSVEGNLDPKRKGTFRLYRNSSYLQIARYHGGTLAELYTVMPYGNSNRPGSLHYADQQQMSAGMGFKKMTFDKAEIAAGAERTYKPQP